MLHLVQGNVSYKISIYAFQRSRIQRRKRDTPCSGSMTQQKYESLKFTFTGERKGCDGTFLRFGETQTQEHHATYAYSHKSYYIRGCKRVYLLRYTCYTKGRMHCGLYRRGGVLRRERRRDFKVSDFQLDLLLRRVCAAFTRESVNARCFVCLRLQRYIEFWAPILTSAVVVWLSCTCLHASAGFPSAIASIFPVYLANIYPSIFHLSFPQRAVTIVQIFFNSSAADRFGKTHLLFVSNSILD